MELVKCPICGEMYSDSYKACPFCAESGPFEGTVKRRRLPGRRLEHRKNPKILGPAMILVVLLLAAVLIYAFFGDQIREKFHKDPVEDPPTEDVQITLEPASVELAVGEIRALTASGIDGNLWWRSSDETVATVDDYGAVTAVGLGKTTITVTDKEEKYSARCEVTVREPGDDPTPDNPTPDNPTPDNPTPDNPTPDNPTPDNPTPAKNLSICTRWNGKELPKTNVEGVGTVYDTTLPVGSGPLTLFVYGTDSPVEWSTDSQAITIDHDGTVRRVSRGDAYVTAKVDGQTLICLIRS